MIQNSKKDIDIKGSSGYTSIDYPYEDKVTITEKFILYEYIPKIKSQQNSKKKYFLHSDEFSEFFSLVKN